MSSSFLGNATQEKFALPTARNPIAIIMIVWVIINVMTLVRRVRLRVGFTIEVYPFSFFGSTRMFF